MFDFDAVRTPDERMGELERFIEFWLGPRQPGYGEEPSVLAAASLPEPLRRLYAFAGRWPVGEDCDPDVVVPLFSAQDSLRPVSRLETSDDGKLIFLDENQGVWTVATLPAGEDPPV